MLIPVLAISACEYYLRKGKATFRKGGWRHAEACLQVADTFIAMMGRGARKVTRRDEQAGDPLANGLRLPKAEVIEVIGPLRQAALVCAAGVCCCVWKCY